MMVNTKNNCSDDRCKSEFFKGVHLIDKNGMTVIMKNNKPRYIVVGFDEYDAISAAMKMKKEKINSAADSIIDKKFEAFRELAK